MSRTPIDSAREGELLARHLVETRKISSAVIEDARREAAIAGGRLATILYERRICGLAMIAAALGDVHGLEGIGPDRFDAIAADVASSLPAKAAVRALAVPVARDGRGLAVAFVEPSDAKALEIVTRETNVPVRPCVAPEPLIYAALTLRYGMSQIPKRLEEMVEEILGGAPRVPAKAVRVPSPPRPESRANSRPMMVPRDPQDYVTTPMGGVLPGSPDERSTAGVGEPSQDLLSPEEILYGGSGGDDDPLSAAQGALTHARDRVTVVAAILDYCKGVVPAAAVIERTGDEFRALAGNGALAAVRLVADASRPSVLNAAASGESGFVGPMPDTSANIAISKGLGRTPAEILLVPLSLARGRELLLYADAGPRPLDPALVERFRTLARRARQGLD